MVQEWPCPIEWVRSRYGSVGRRPAIGRGGAGYRAVFAAGHRGGPPPALSVRHGTARALHPLAVLPGQVPVLRLQLACAGPHPAGVGSAPRCAPSWPGRRDRLGRRPLGSIFFGGGTPSLMQPETVAALIDDARTLVRRRSRTLEITLEANPTSVEAGAPRRLPRRPG